MGIPKDSPAGRREFERVMEQRRRAADASEYTQIRRGWFVGDDGFREELLEKVAGKRGANHYGPEIRESEEAKAERLIKEELKARKRVEKDLKELGKCDPEKVAMAARLRQETTMTIGWIADRLSVGVPSTLNSRCIGAGA